MLKLRLARIWLPPFVQLNILSYSPDSKNNLEEVVYEHSELFSRMFGHTKEDYGKGVYRYIFEDEDAFFTQIQKDENNKEIKKVYCLDKENCEYKYLCDYKDFVKNEEYMERLQMIQSKKLAMQKLTNEAELLLTDERLANSEFVDLSIRNGDIEFVCIKTDFIQPIGVIVIPVLSDNKYGFELKEFGYTNSFYRMTNFPSRNSYLPFPQGISYGFYNRLEMDQDYGLITIYNKDNEEVVSIADSDLYKDSETAKTAREQISKLAIQEHVLMSKVVDLDDKNTEVYMEFRE